MEQKNKELKEAIDKLSEIMGRSVSLKENFFKGMVYGLGFFIGGTVLVAIVITVLSRYNTAPYIGDFISKILNVIENK